jgi:hypothetical protein
VDQKSSKYFLRKKYSNYTLTRLENFSATREGSFYSTAGTFVKVLKQWGLGYDKQYKKSLSIVPSIVYQGRYLPNTIFTKGPDQYVCGGESEA